MNVSDYWHKFCDEDRQFERDAEYQVWYFGNSSAMAEELVELVLQGKKIATASLQNVNLAVPENAPKLNGISVVTTFDGEPRCIVRTTEIKLLPYDEVPADIAFDEGEGDQSLEYWRRVHHEYFTKEAAELGVEFNERSLVCCERFELLYPK